MSDFDSVALAQNNGFTTIFGIAKGALESLKQISSLASITPPNIQIQDLAFDPGAPTTIKIMNSSSIDSVLRDIDTWISKLDRITAPSFPDNPNIEMLDHEVWNEQFMDSMKSNLNSYLDSMGIPDKKYQDAIFMEEYDRNLLTLNDLYELADAKTGARGFSYTNDFGNSLKLDAQVKYQFDKTQISRSISKTITEWARQNYQFAIEKGLSLEQLHMDFTYKYCTAAIQIYKDTVMALLERFKAEVEVALAPAEALMKELEALLGYTKVSAEIDKTNETLKQSRSELEIKEGLGKYQSILTTLVAEYQTMIHALEQSAAQSAGLAQAVSSSVIGFTKK